METLVAEKWTYQDMLENLPADSCYELIMNFTKCQHLTLNTKGLP